MARGPDDANLTPEEREAARSLLGAFKDLSAADVEGALKDLRADTPAEPPRIGPTGAPTGGKGKGPNDTRVMPAAGSGPTRAMPSLPPTSKPDTPGSGPTRAMPSLPPTSKPDTPSSGATRAMPPTSKPTEMGSGATRAMPSAPPSPARPSAEKPSEPAATRLGKEETSSKWSEKLKSTHYRYRAKDASGQIHEGYVDATSLEKARKELMARFPALLDLTEMAGPQQRTQTIRVNGDRVVVFYRRLASMLDAGVTVTRAIEFLRSSEDDPKLAEVLEDLSEALHSGRSLSHTMGSGYLRHVFSPAAVGLVAMGEQTGNLVDAIGKLADLTEVQMRQRRAVLSAMTYPAVLLVVILLVTGVFIVILGPGDSGLFALFGGKLPWPTQVLVGLAKVLRSPWILIAVAAAVALLVVWVRRMLQVNATLRLKVHERILELPVVGPLVQKTLSARMLYVMCCAIQVGVPMIKALQMARDVCTNDALGRSFEGAVHVFRNGDDLADALERFDVFPKLVTSMIHMGVETANLDSVLLRVSRTYEEEVEMALNDAVRLAEPVLLCFAGVLAAFMALATLLPVIEVVNKL